MVIDGQLFHTFGSGYFQLVLTMIPFRLGHSQMGHLHKPLIFQTIQFTHKSFLGNVAHGLLYQLVDCLVLVAHKSCIDLDQWQGFSL